MTANTMRTAVCEIATAIQTTEIADDRAIAAIGALIAATANARAETGIAPARAQKPLQILLEQLGQRLLGRQQVIELHHMLGRIAAEEGETPDTWGPAWPCPQGHANVAPVKLAVAA